MSKIKEILFKPRLLFLAPKKDEEVTLSPIQIALRVLVAFVTAAWVGFIPLYLFVIYMHQNKFFSYDFFVDGVFGLNTFIVATGILLIFMSIYFYGFVLFAKLGIQQQRDKQKNGYRLLTWIFILVSIFMHVLFFDLSLKNDKPYLIVWLMGISAVLCAFLYSFIGHGFKKSLQNWLSPVLFVAASIFLPFFYQEVTSEVVAMSLRGFNMGGGQRIQISEQNREPTTESAEFSSLMLITPKNAYVKNAENKLLIIPISDHTEVKIW